jgi:hypothetical protein
MWLKVESKFPSHPKVCDAGDRLGAYGSGRVLALWLFASAYAVDQLTDGFIPRAVIAQCPHVRQPLVVAQAMVAAGLWHRANGGWDVHDFSRYNPSGSAVKASRDHERDKKRRQRASCPPSVPHSVPAMSRGDKSFVPPLVPGDSGGDSRARASESEIEIDPSTEVQEISSTPLRVAEPAVLTFPTVGDVHVTSWALIPSQIAEWEVAYPNVDVLAEARKALVWVQANPVKRKTARGMPKFLVAWLTRSVDSNRAVRPPASRTLSTAPRWYDECALLHSRTCADSNEHWLKVAKAADPVTT